MAARSSAVRWTSTAREFSSTRERRVEPGDIARHETLRLPGLEATRPGLRGIRELAERLRDRPCSGGAERVAGLARAALHDVQPFALALDLLQWELARGRHVKHREPVDRRVVLRCRGLTRRLCRGQVQQPAWRRLHAGRVDQPVAAHPHVVVRLRQIRQDVPPAVIGDDDLRELRRQVRRLRDDPYPSLGATGTTDDPANIVAVDLNRLGGQLEGACLAHRGEEDRQTQACACCHGYI